MELPPPCHDMAPSSDFLREFFCEDAQRTRPRALPVQVQFHLLFGFRMDGVGRVANHGSASVASQTRPETQEQAATLRAYDRGDVEILHRADAVARVNQLLASRFPRAAFGAGGYAGRVTRPPSPWKRRLAVGGLVVLGIVALVQLALPRLLASQLAAAAASALGRRVEVGRLELDWLPGRLAVTDLVIGGPQDAPSVAPERAPLRFARVGLDLSWASLLAGEVHLSDLTLEAPALYFERDARGALSPLVLARPEPEPEPEEAPDAGGAGWPIRLDAISIRNLTLHVARSDEAERRDVELTLEELSLAQLVLREGAVSVGAIAFQDPGLRVQRSIVEATPGSGEAPPADVAARPPAGEAAARDAQQGLLEGHRLDSLDVNGARFTLLWEGGEPLEVGLDLSASAVTAGPGAHFPLALTLHVEGGSIGLEGELGVQPLSFAGVVRWQDLALPRLLEASGVEAGVELAAGRSAGELRVALTSLAQGDTPAGLRLSGGAEVSELDAALPELDLAWSKLTLEAESLWFPFAVDEPPGIALSRVSLVEPRLVYARAPSALAAEAAPSSQAPPSASPDAAAPRISLDELLVERGSLRFRDSTPAQPVETRWEKIALRGRGLRWPEREAESLKLTASGSGGAQLTVDASFAGGRGRIESRLHRVALAPFDPYAAQYTGVRIDEGRGSVRSLVEIDGQSVRTDSVVDLHRLRLHEQEAGWFQRVFGLPLDLALALLRNLEGDIRVPVVAQLSAGQTQIGFASLLASTLRQAILGALTSPLKLLGSVTQTAGDVLGAGLAPIQAVPGDPAIEASEQPRLEQLAELLDEKPELTLMLRGRAGPADDAGIARRRLILQARSGESLEGDDALGFLQRRRVRAALAALDPDAPAALEPETEALVSKLVAAAHVDDDDRRALARERAARVRERLVDGLGLTDAAVSVEEAAIGDPGVGVELRARVDARAGDASG